MFYLIALTCVCVWLRELIAQFYLFILGLISSAEVRNSCLRARVRDEERWKLLTRLLLLFTPSHYPLLTHAKAKITAYLGSHLNRPGFSILTVSFLTVLLCKRPPLTLHLQLVNLSFVLLNAVWEHRHYQIVQNACLLHLAIVASCHQAPAWV